MASPLFWIWMSLFIHALVCLSSFPPPTKAISGNETDRLSLLEFKSKITNDPFEVMNSWNDTIHFCQWHGVVCGRRHQRVTVLDLSSLKLTGSISPYIGNLSFLRILNLQNNSLYGEISPEVGRLRRMQRIMLANNSLTGDIPANLSYCTYINVIDFSFNKLVGKISGEFASLSQLQYFSVRLNNIAGGIPSFFGNFSSLYWFDAAGNNLFGSIPEALGRLTNLKIFNLALNYLSGTIPSSMYNISSITSFILVQNQFQGTFPSDLGITLPNLKIFSVGLNQFTGVIPQSISNATKLYAFSAPGNNLAGKVPNLERLNNLQLLSFSINQLGTGEDDLSFVSSMENATSLRMLYLNGNNFQGLLPKSLGNLSITLDTLALSYNQFSGHIPTEILKLKNLQVLLLNNNKLTGVIPPDIGMLQNLHYFFVSENKLSGNIPSSIGNLSLLAELRLYGNNFQGHIPSDIGNCHNLQALSLSNNNLTGTIPKEILSLSSLSLYLDLSNNHLTGSLPVEVGKLINLGELNVSYNMLFGQIPSTLGSCVKMEILSIRVNFIQGEIPSTLSSLRGLQVLDLSHNNLTGQIPMFLKDLNSLEYLNLSFNNIEGMVPVEGVFKNASATSVEGNSKLCGGIPEFHLSTCKSKESNKRGLSLAMMLTIIICGILGITSLLYFLYRLLVHKKKSMRDSNCTGFLQVSYQNLLKATDGFSSANLIGMGNFGSVYKGMLEEDGTVVAVKVLNLRQPGASKSFIAECEALRGIRHRNLVRILTVCSSIDSHGNDFKALVYDFMPNGSLEEWLHPSRMKEEVEASKSLNFLQRLDIAIDMACALDYLHHQCETPIVHCDLKPSNVLLDSDMTAQVADFGLAKFLQEANRVTESSSIGVRGTVGYAAPEYGMGSEVSTRGDVYSYGILLLELFTGKRPVDDMFEEGLDLHRFTRVALLERVVKIMDSFLLQEILGSDLNRGHKVHECISSIFEVGLSCSAEIPQERMNMNDVAAKLQSLRRKFL